MDISSKNLYVYENSTKQFYKVTDVDFLSDDILEYELKIVAKNKSSKTIIETIEESDIDLIEYDDSNLEHTEYVNQYYIIEDFAMALVICGFNILNWELAEKLGFEMNNYKCAI